MSDAPVAVARSLGALHNRIRRCVHCPLHLGRKHAVPGEGSRRPRVVFVGEGPGENEDEVGRPFVGRAGRFLGTLLREFGLGRQDIFITSCVKCRPPHNRDPRRRELDTCCGLWLGRQVKLLDPQILLLLGRVAIRQVLGESGKLSDLHGQLRQCGERRYMFTYHPAAGMRFPDAEAAMWDDFSKLADLL